MKFMDLIAGIFKPATDLIDSLHTSEEEKIRAKGELTVIFAGILNSALEYESKILEAKASIIRAEATGQSWLQRNWRPITMITFLALVVCDSFGLLTFRLAEQAWTLLQIGLGGYVVGRSVEKVAPSVLEALKK